MEYSFWEEQSMIEILYAKFTEPVCRKFDLTKTELDILLFLANNTMYDSASEIVRRRHISKAHVSLSLRTLEERKMVTAAYAANNHRTLHLSLLPAADAVVAAGRDAQRRFYQAATEDFSQQERKQFCKALDRIAVNARKYINTKD